MTTQQTVEQAQTALVEEFSFLDDWTERYQQIIDMGRRLPPYPEAYKTDALKVRGCQSQVWIRPYRERDCLRFDAVSDAAIVCGLIAILLRVYDNRHPEDILAADTTFIEALGLDSHLSPTRRNGLFAMLTVIRGEAERAVGAQDGAA